MKALVGCSAILTCALVLIWFGLLVIGGAPPRFWGVKEFFYGLLPISAGLRVFALALRVCHRGFERRVSRWAAAFVALLAAAAMNVPIFRFIVSEPEDAIQRNWHPESGVFYWGLASVTIPHGFAHEEQTGMDTMVGRFASAAANVEISYDIGELAGEHGGGRGDQETFVRGTRVFKGRTARPDEGGKIRHFSKLSFPDSGCANFRVVSANEGDLDLIDAMARSYRPRGWRPAFVRPLLPNLLRSDCRYRLDFSWLF
jgi:hypothetical protein